MASQIVNSDLWNEIQKLNIKFYRIQIEALMTKANQTLYQIDRLNISSYEAQIQTLLRNANQTMAQLNNVILQIAHILPPKL